MVASIVVTAGNIYSIASAVGRLDGSQRSRRESFGIAQRCLSIVGVAGATPCQTVVLGIRPALVGIIKIEGHLQGIAIGKRGICRSAPPGQCGNRPGHCQRSCREDRCHSFLPILHVECTPYHDHVAFPFHCTIRTSRLHKLLINLSYHKFSSLSRIFAISGVKNGQRAASPADAGNAALL